MSKKNEINKSKSVQFDLVISIGRKKRESICKKLDEERHFLNSKEIGNTVSRELLTSGSNMVAIQNTATDVETSNADCVRSRISSNASEQSILSAKRLRKLVRRIIPCLVRKHNAGMIDMYMPQTEDCSSNNSQWKNSKQKHLISIDLDIEDERIIAAASAASTDKDENFASFIKKTRSLDFLKSMNSKRKSISGNNNAMELISMKLDDIMKSSDVIDLTQDDEELTVDYCNSGEHPSLSNEQEDIIKTVISCGPETEVIVSKFNLHINRSDLITLTGHNWVNDNIINFYLNLLMQRHRYNISVYAMNTFFLPKLLQSGYAGVKRWTQSVNIFSYKMILIPVHVDNSHWCMAVIDFRDESIRYYNSYRHSNSPVMDALERYLKEEYWDLKGKPLIMKHWSIENMKNSPRQRNNYDCGVFSCMVAEYLTRDAPLTFTQKQMPYFRQKMILEIITCHLLL